MWQVLRVVAHTLRMCLIKSWHFDLGVVPRFACLPSDVLPKRQPRLNVWTRLVGFDMAEASRCDDVA